MCTGPCLEHCYNTDIKTFIYGLLVGIIIYHMYNEYNKQNKK